MPTSSRVIAPPVLVIVEVPPTVSAPDCVMAPPAVSTKFPLNVLKLVAGKLIAALSKIRLRFPRDKAVVALGVSAVAAVFLKLKSWKFAPPVITTFGLAMLFRMGFPFESVARFTDVVGPVATMVKFPAVAREVIEVPDC